MSRLYVSMKETVHGDYRIFRVDTDSLSAMPLLIIRAVDYKDSRMLEHAATTLATLFTAGVLKEHYE